ncbi:PREDICTED: beta-galactoside alpha-2,6-sialyltransferase 2-like [Branchiostoma belcheri]|uniref:beta-galactoside alpha-(2,6)-sialyltransferase n=1 Tax=Branchiostoma belcheri TaxID=7741 RepID=A0A6P4YJA7_BRABE|nr:PREDICTED: beta-galactoside alpha-2,6-sialyltransferase 2-like [Branchiostoma belcheri]
MVDRRHIFIAVLCLCIFGNILLIEFPITVIIGSPHGNTTGLQFRLVGIGVPTTLGNVGNVQRVMPRPVGAHITYNTTQTQLLLNVDTTTSKPSFTGETGNVSLLNSTMEDPQTIMWREEMLCKIKTKIPFSTISKTSVKKSTDQAVLPEERMETVVHYNTCAVVGSGHGSRLHTYGREIDGHDAVLRFNCAPTEKFEEFVGSRTDIRLINTQIPGRECTNEFWNDSIAMFNHEITVIRNINAINLAPSGVVMMLHLCNWVHVYGIVPSTRDKTNLRYYYNERPAVTHGVHSFGQERQYIRTLSLTSDQDMDDTGIALLQGLATVHCDSHELH